MKYLTLFLALLLGASSPRAAEEQRLDEILSGGFSYRNVGPFRAGSWVADLAVPEAPARAHLYTFYVGARNGGVWKTTNNGTTFQPLFDEQNVLSIGALAVAPTDENIVWVGTGDASCTRSAYHGDGIYKSTDAGRSWQHLGLADSHHIARIVIDPANADVVYVAAMGHLFSTNEERGVFKTIDGGKSWKKILYLNERTGAIDLLLDRRHPNTLYAAMYECVRYPWQLADGGPGSGIYKTADSGATWKRLEGGLPTGAIGRIGLDLYQKDPGVLYAIVDNRNRSKATADELEAGRGRGPGRGPRLIGGEVYRTDDAGGTWRKMNSARDDLSRKSGYAFNQIRVDPGNPDNIFITGETLANSRDGGRTWTSLTESRTQRPFRKAFGDFRTLWIDPENPDRMMAGSDGGVFLSYDGGKSCDHLANLPLGEVYALTLDMESPYNIYAGLQDHESWKGPSDGWSDSVGEEDWTTVGIGDGMYNQVDPTDSRWVYNTQEFGRHARYDQKTRERKTIAPTRPPDQPRLRFNWVAPLLLSPHDAKTLYAGAQVLFRSSDRGDHWQEISADLTGNDTNKISPPGASIQFCTITTIAESPARPGVLWVGTDDGKVQVTKDGGANWTDATKAIALAGGPVDAWVTRVSASPTVPGVAYVAKSRHRQDDFRPFVFKTTDFGATWTAITNRLPVRPVNVIVEDYTNANLLFLGNDTGIYVSLDAGARWSPLKGNMPPVPVNALSIHAPDGDLVAGTFGRGIWITDIAPLRELNQATLDQDVHFFATQPRAWRRQGALGNYHLYGDRHVVTPNGPNGLIFEYYLKSPATNQASITIADSTGATVRTQPGPAKAGLNRVVLTARPPGQFDGPGDSSRRPLPPGDYTASLHVGERTFTQKVRVPASSVLEEASENENPDENEP
jgi:photosystem II stability/assembly factor-like uncharacterized protein